MTGPLQGVRVLEIASIGPGPFGAMLLADLGAEVVRVDRSDVVGAAEINSPVDPMLRGRRSIGVNLKNRNGVETVLQLAESADALIEGFRPGVAERLGIGPNDCRSRNPRLVYARMTGWGQDGPYAQAPGHDINYIALAGALEGIGRQGEPPVPPHNLLGDFGGGGMFLVVGLVSALFEASRSGEGQVLDVAMVDGVALLTSMLYGLRAAGTLSPERGTNFFDTGSHFYNVYETSDGKFISIGSYEQRFYIALRRELGLSGERWEPQKDPLKWPDQKLELAKIFRTRSRDEWCERLEDTDVCFAPVLSLDEAHAHPHHRARGTFIHHNGVLQPSPGPRFSRTRPQLELPPANPGQHTVEVLRAWGFDGTSIERLLDTGAVSGNES